MRKRERERERNLYRERERERDNTDWMYVYNALSCDNPTVNMRSVWPPPRTKEMLRWAAFDYDRLPWLLRTGKNHPHTVPHRTAPCRYRRATEAGEWCWSRRASGGRLPSESRVSNRVHSMKDTNWVSNYYYNYYVYFPTILVWFIVSGISLINLITITNGRCSSEEPRFISPEMT